MIIPPAPFQTGPGREETTMRIITVSRQFGSGGRELGKRLAGILNWDYYDREIIAALADEQGLDPEYVRRTLSTHGWHNYQLTYRNSFQRSLAPSFHTGSLLAGQREIILEIAQAGNDCVIVGRDADVILHDMAPFRVFVCADIASRLERCMAHETKKEAGERLSEKEILRNIRRIDRDRMHTREVLTGKHAADFSAFDLIVNTSDKNIRNLAEAVASYSAHWFENDDKTARG